MKKDYYRITADIPTEMAIDLDFQLRKHKLMLRGKWGCGKRLYEILLRREIDAMLSDPVYARKFILEIINEKGRGDAN